MIDRRSLLSWLGVSVGGALDPGSGDGEQRPKTAGVVALESFHVADAKQMPRLHAYLGGALLPLLNEIHHRAGICLEAIVAPKTPQALVLASFSSFDEMLATRSRVAAHHPIQNMRAELESAGVFTEVRSQVFICTQDRLQFPLDSDRLKAGIFEMRSYHCPAWQAGPPSTLTAVLHRAGIRPILNAAFAAGEHIPQFTFLIPFESLAARQEAWSRLGADPDWIDIEREAAKDGLCLKVTAKSIYKLTPYSRLA